MSNDNKPGSDQDPTEDRPMKGLSLTLAYSLIALGLFAAICIAFFIVLPFYHRH
jgi:hypothetical protein